MPVTSVTLSSTRADVVPWRSPSKVIEGLLRSYSRPLVLLYILNVIALPLSSSEVVKLPGMLKRK